MVIYRSPLALAVICGLLVAGCVGTRVEYLTDEHYPARADEDRVEWLSTLPSQPYQELARITVSSANYGEERLRRSLLERAGTLGADAVIPEAPMVVVSPAPAPYYEPGLFGPMGAAFNLYGYGWYTPYTSNPYIFVQGAVDQPRVDRYVSGIAIRYEPSPPAVSSLTGAEPTN
jgi:hypothetical protein